VFSTSASRRLMTSTQGICIRFRSAPFGAVPAQSAREENAH